MFWKERAARQGHGGGKQGAPSLPMGIPAFARVKMLLNHPQVGVFGEMPVQTPPGSEIVGWCFNPGHKYQALAEGAVLEHPRPQP